MGVIVTLEEGDDPDQDSTAIPAYRSGSNSYQTGFPLTRVSEHRFVGSLFWLTSGTEYNVQVQLSDPDGCSLDGLLLSDHASTRSEPDYPIPTTIYEVSPDGTGTACSESEPCSLSTAMASVNPGEKVRLGAGTYYEGELAPAQSGTSNSPIIIEGVSEDSVILDGSDPATFTWTHQGDGVYQTTNAPDSTHVVLADGERLFPYEDLDGLASLDWENTPGFYSSGTTLYVHLAGNANPATKVMTVSRYNNAFGVTQDHIVFRKMTFRYYGRGSYAKAIYVNNASNVTIENCSFESNDLGVGIKRLCNQTVIQDCTFSDTIFNWPWDGIKSVGGIEDGGIRLYSPMDGRGTVIRRNKFHDDFDGFGVAPDSTAAVTNETDVYENTIWNMGDDGVEADGRASNVRIWDNTFYDVLMGISLAPVYDGPVYAIRNVVHRTGVGNNSYTGSPFKFNSGYDPSGTIYLFHNTADAYYSGNNGLYIKSPGDWELIYARNNIWCGTNYALNNYNTENPTDLDRDNLYNAGANDLVWWDAVRYDTLAAFAAAIGQEATGFSVEPQFENSDTGDYRLQRSSPLVDAGELIPGINHNYKGTAPDIGAFEIESVNVLPAFLILLSE